MDRAIDQKATISEIGEGDCTGDLDRPEIPKYCGEGTSRSWGGLLSGIIGAGKSLCNTCKACNGYAKRHTISQVNKGGYLVYGINKDIDY